MGGLFSKPKAPKMPPPPKAPPPVPTVDTPAVQAAADAQRRMPRSGKASTVLTNQDAPDDTMTARKKLLG
jgi:hypothetical protein